MLDPYSQKQKQRLEKLKPDWLPFFEEYPYKDSEKCYLLVTIPSVGNNRVTLKLYTADEEITVCFGVWEWHYPNPSEPDIDELEAAMSEVNRIQQEEHLIASYWCGERWVGSRIVSPGEQLEFTELAKEASTVKVLSWSGALNREIAL